jgi:hypothetical protein
LRRPPGMIPHSLASCRDFSPPSGASSMSTSSPATSPVRSRPCASVSGCSSTSPEAAASLNRHHA